MGTADRVSRPELIGLQVLLADVVICPCRRKERLGGSVQWRKWRPSPPFWNGMSDGRRGWRTHAGPVTRSRPVQGAAASGSFLPATQQKARGGGRPKQPKGRTTRLCSAPATRQGRHRAPARRSRRHLRRRHTTRRTRHRLARWSPPAQPRCRTASVDMTAVDAPLAQVVGRQFDRDPIPGQNADMVLAHFAGRVGDEFVAVFEGHSES